ncbi:hypothetical protein C8R43DRAFT_1043856 [Mycena crocata]|nr:hypothetical protein C8R43DRAFT_1043856 [Mycena crocata]
MSPPPLPPKSTPKSKPPADGDHRKRRRNRCTQSCMNCHATKRMCDRKRPCSRCSQLGLSGNCVYEVDDPSRQGKQDDARLMGRIAELEGVIRELKQKPHPRWLSEQDSASSTSDGSRSSPPSSGGPPTPNIPVWSFPSSPRYKPPGSPPQFPPQASGPSSAYSNDALDSLFSVYAGLSEHRFIRRGGSCGCLNEATCYNVVLELSLRLRKATDVLARFPGHSNNSACAMNTRISELDTLVKNLLLNFPNRSALSSDLGSEIPSISSTLFDQHYSNNDGTFLWDMDDISGQNDDFMSWMPARGNM